MLGWGGGEGEKERGSGGGVDIVSRATPLNHKERGVW